MKKIRKSFRVNAPCGVSVYTVSGTEVRSVYTDWIGGSHWYADPGLVPKNQIWIERMRSKQEERYLLAHEMAEYVLMKHKGFGYAKAHAAANVVEKALRNDNCPLIVFERHLRAFWPTTPTPILRKGALAFTKAYKSY